MLEINSKAKTKTPYINVCLQECERMNILLGEIRNSLTDLEAGLAGKLNVTDSMDALAQAL
jgi:dynein heavy chain